MGVGVCMLPQIDFEKSNSKKLEKDLRRTLAALEEERASAARHKQVALLLLKERKHILQKLAAQSKVMHKQVVLLLVKQRQDILQKFAALPYHVVLVLLLQGI
jgi:restriction endonuclease